MVAVRFQKGRVYLVSGRQGDFGQASCKPTARFDVAYCQNGITRGPEGGLKHQKVGFAEYYGMLLGIP